MMGNIKQFFFSAARKWPCLPERSSSVPWMPAPPGSPGERRPQESRTLLLPEGCGACRFLTFDLLLILAPTLCSFTYRQRLPWTLSADGGGRGRFYMPQAAFVTNPLTHDRTARQRSRLPCACGPPSVV